MANLLRTPAGSHERIAVVELFGRNWAKLRLSRYYLADVDRALISYAIPTSSAWPSY
ncbi:MAG: hypothetical protein U0074_07620 [Kouleothrix sp.]